MKNNIVKFIKSNKIFETGVILFAFAGFWGMIYPDLCFTQDVCIETYENTMEEDIYTQLCKAEPEQIKVKSRLLEYLTEKGSKLKIKESKGKNHVTDKGQRIIE